MNIRTTLERAVVGSPSKVGVVDGDRRFTYAEFGARVDALAGYLRRQGVQPGQVLSILHENAHEYLESYYAAASLGAILNPLNTRLSAEEIHFVLKDAGARWLIASATLAPLAEAVLTEGTGLVGVLRTRGDPPPGAVAIPSVPYEKALASAPDFFEPAAVTGDDVAHLFYTSGTTGAPKGVMLTHRNVTVHALGVIAELGLNETDVCAHVGPLFHLADSWAAFAVTWAEGRHVLVPRFDPAAVLATLERERITLTALVPTMFNMLVNHPDVSRYDYSSLRLALSGGAPIAPALVRKVIETFRCEFANAYGLTETSGLLAFSLLNHHLRELPAEEQLVYRAKTGRPFMCVELRVMDEAGRPVAADERQVGEIQARGDTITPGYRNRPQATAEAFRHGWFCTGDLAVVDAEGYLTIVDRKKDMIVTGGENVYSAEVENVLYACPGVREAAVFGIPDEKWGEAVKAAVALAPGVTLTEAEIVAFCKAHLDGYKAPKSVDFLPALPHTGSGKIFKKALRDPYWAGRTQRV